MASLFFINQYASTPDRGFGGRFYYIAKDLQKKGHEVTLITSANHHLLRERPLFRGLWHNEVYDGLKVLWLKTLPYSKANSPVRVLNWFLFALYMPFLFFLKQRPEVVHYSSPSPVGFIGVWLYSKLINAKSCFDVRDVWPETLVAVGNIRRNHPFIRLLFIIEKFCCSKADYVTSNLANFDLRLEELGLSTDKFSWVPNGVSIEDIEYSYANSNIKLPSACTEKFVVAYTGTFGEANALKQMLQVAKKMLHTSDVVFLLVGHGKEREELEAYCENNLLSNVIFQDSVAKKDIYKLQALVDILCVGAKPSELYKYGVAPNKMYEYIYSGVPIIYYINTPNYHPIYDAGAGLEISSTSVEEFKNAIFKLKQLPKYDRDIMAQKAKLYINKNHVYSSISLKLLKVCNVRDNS